MPTHSFRRALLRAVGALVRTVFGYVCLVPAVASYISFTPERANKPMHRWRHVNFGHAKSTPANFHAFVAPRTKSEPYAHVEATLPPLVPS